MGKKIISYFTVMLFLILNGTMISANELPFLVGGVPDQVLPDITVSVAETHPFDFHSGASNKIALRFPEGVEPTAAGKVLVQSGDIVLDSSGTTITKGIDTGAGLSDSSHYYVWCRVLSPNAKPTTLSFQGIKVTLDRTVPQGGLGIWLTGDFLDNTQSQFPGENEPSAVIATVVPFGSEAHNTATFVVGQSSYTVNGVEKNLDAPPFIDSAGRTLMPVRAMAESIGAIVGWDEDTQTVSVLRGNSAVSVQVNSKNLNVNGVMVNMGRTAIMKDGHLFLPFRAIAEALGAKVDWNPETKKLTIS
jgi:hypothetical protein